ncbi:MAG: hypothetical protein A2W91_13965 [Bacteroidetes bacterium GWF2_38_335]|nr:MAG: hypothetical protein A2W91_13965 [Bacteroidetes bacterium GWF2_38_335]OFY77820.1 MAG: hypothetical protein A2281_15655 [Bacteroidetes bacterium RIFOXYA12_FULL_38_20]HBS87372.1 TetR/AcrR family transcriptional regulator [Bacteroidales bacterium]
MGIIERKEREKEQRRNDIVDAAERVFLRKGFENTTVDDVAAEAELSKGTVYLYFKSKDELHYAINLRAMQKLNKIIRGVYDEKKDVVVNLEAMGNVFIKFAEEFRIYFEAILHFNSKSLANIEPCMTHDLLSDESPISFLVELIDKGKSKGEIRSDMNSILIVELLWSQIMGVLQFVFYKQELFKMFNITSEQVLTGLFEILKNGVRKSLEK